MIRTRICERCGKPFETRSAETKICCHHSGSTSKRHGMSYTPTHNSWCDMRKRCNDPGHHAYAWYGGRGIKVCERWNKFENFFADMGVKPDGLTLDRKDTNGDYEPDNCRWATPLEQGRNRRGVYTAEEDTKLRRMLIDERATYQQVADALGKSKGSVQSYAGRKGIPYAHTPLKITDRPGHPLRQSVLCVHEEQR